MQKRKGGDATGWKRGAKGFANSKGDAEFMRTRNPKADHVTYGEPAVGMAATADDPQVVNNAHVEGSDC